MMTNYQINEVQHIQRPRNMKPKLQIINLNLFMLSIQGQQSNLFLFNTNQNKKQEKVQNITLNIQTLYIENKFLPIFPLLPILPSTVDSTLNSMLHHLCSFNSPYTYTYLSIPQAKNELNLTNQYGFKPLDVAIMYADQQIMKKMMQMGATSSNFSYWCTRAGMFYPKVDINYLDSQGNTVIHFAAMNNMPEICQIGFRMGGKDIINKMNLKKQTPLTIAIKRCSYHCLPMLLELCQLRQNQKIQLEECKSPFINKIYKNHQQRQKMKQIKSYSYKDLFCNVYDKILIYILFFIFTIGISGKTNVSILTMILCIACYFYTFPNYRLRMTHNRNIFFKSSFYFKPLAIGPSSLKFLLLILIHNIHLFIAVWTCIKTGWIITILYVPLFLITFFYTMNSVSYLYCLITNITPMQLFKRHMCLYMYKELKVDPKGYVNVVWKNNFSEGILKNLIKLIIH